MKLKNIVAALSGTLLAVSLVACSSSAGGSGSAQGGSGDKTYIIASDNGFAPFEFAKADNTYTGIDMDLLDAIAKDQGFSYEVQNVGFKMAVSSLEAGQVDGVIAGMSITEERREKFDFSDPYYDSTVCCATLADSEINKLEDLNGKNVAVKDGTESQKWAESIKDKYGFTTTTFKDSATMYQEVGGNSVACFEDTPVMAYSISQYKATEGKEGKNFKIIGEVSPDDAFASQYGFAVQKGKNTELLKKFNDGLANIKKSGKYEEIVKQYLG